MWFNSIATGNLFGISNINNVKTNKQSYGVNFGQTLTQDTFQNNSPAKLFNELAIRKMIADNPIVRKYLNVCSYGKKNCGHCTKCIRTMVALDIMGRLDDFIDVFEDVSYYRKYRWKFITHMREASDKDIFYYDMQKYACKNGFRYSIKENLYHCTYPLRRLRMSLIKLFCK